MTRKFTRRDFYVTFLLASIGFIPFLAIGQRKAPTIPLDTDYNHKKMEADIKRVIPLGTPFSKAKEVAEASNFQCEILKSGDLGCSNDNRWASISAGIDWYIEFKCRAGVVRGVAVIISPE